MITMQLVAQEIDRVGGDRVSGTLEVLATIYNDDAEVFEIALHSLRLANLDMQK